MFMKMNKKQFYQLIMFFICCFFKTIKDFLNHGKSNLDFPKEN